MPSSDRCIRAVKLASISHLKMEKSNLIEVVLANIVARPLQKERRCSYQPRAQPKASLNVVTTPWLSMATRRTLSELYTFNRERVGELDPTVAIDALGRGLDENVDLMQRTRNLQNLMFDTRNNAGHDTSVPAYHGVFVVG
ncbi:unnamed protein product [Sphagnum balticum]